jgi:hypothetical protein
MEVHGKATAVSLGGVDLEEFGTDFEWSRKADKHDLTTFASAAASGAHRYRGGLLDGTATLTGWYDSALVTGPRAAINTKLGTVQDCVYRPEGQGAGKPQDNVDVLVEEYTESSPVADYVKFTVKLQLSDGVVTVAQ